MLAVSREQAHRNESSSTSPRIARIMGAQRFSSIAAGSSVELFVLRFFDLFGRSWPIATANPQFRSHVWFLCASDPGRERFSGIPQEDCFRARSGGEHFPQGG